MTVVVAYKWAANPQAATVSADGIINWGGKPGLSEYDPVAFRLARLFADETGEQVVGITVGSTAVASVKAVQAAGARKLDQLITVADDSLADAPGLEKANLLAQVVRQLGDVSLVLTGDASVDGASKTFPGLLAAHLGWPVFTEVSSLSKTGDTLTLRRAYQGGTQELTLPAPAVVSVSTDAVDVPVPGMKDLMQAKKVPHVAQPVADLTLAAPQGHIEVTARTKPASKARNHQIFNGEDAVAQLVSALRSQGTI